MYASQGPTLFMVSNDAANMAVSTLSRLDGMTISPLDRPAFELILTLILPIRPVFCNYRKSRSLLKSPSVCPKIAPTTSGFSTIPLALI